MNKTTASTTTTGSPLWWNDQHTSAWDRVKEALRRDWEQTKADFSSQGRDLNQNLVDTVKQAAGSEPVPPPTVKTRPDEPADVAKNIEKNLKEQNKAQAKVADAQTEMAVEQVRADGKIAQVKHEADEKVRKEQMKAAEASAKAAENIAEVRTKAAEKAAEVREKAQDGIAKQQEKVAEARRDWSQAESAVRYGYGARTQYAGSNWDNQLEDRLRREWTDLKNGTSWDDARSYVRHGWDYASRPA